MSGFGALVLAGSRGGPDPVADYAQVAHKGLIVVQGQTLLERVTGALKAAGAARIAVSADQDEVMALAKALGCEVLAPAPGPSQSVAAGFEQLGAPLLVTTVDHALLSPEWIARFLADAPPGADICALLARREVVEAAAPGTRRTYFRLADGEWSGCNLFLLATPRAQAALALWRQVEAERKQPWKIAARLGPGTLVSYALGRLTLEDAVRRLGKLARVNAAAVATPFGLAAVDVDRPADLDLVRRLTGG